jgi:Glycosyl transferase family 2
MSATLREADRAGVDTIVRFHDPARVDELRRCIFSLVAQRHRPLHVIVALQRFGRDEAARTREALAPLFALRGAPELTLLDFDRPEPRDARSELLNMGLAAARSRFVGFLDYDDVLYPDAYERLLERMLDTNAAIAFASVRVVRVDVHEHFQFTRGVVTEPFSGSSLDDLFRANFCPIHSYLIDRTQVPPDVLWFDSSLAWTEDYDLLLRICARFRSDFSLLGVEIGDYVYKTDGSNTVAPDGEIAPEQLAARKLAHERIDLRRRTTEVAPDVQRVLGLRPVPGLTIADVLASGKVGAARRSA